MRRSGVRVTQAAPAFPLNLLDNLPHRERLSHCRGSKVEAYWRCAHPAATGRWCWPVFDRRRSLTNVSRSSRAYLTLPPSLTNGGPSPRKRQSSSVRCDSVRKRAASLVLKKRGWVVRAGPAKCSEVMVGEVTRTWRASLSEVLPATASLGVVKPASEPGTGQSASGSLSPCRSSWG